MRKLACVLLLLLLPACSGSGPELPPSAGTGPRPSLPEPKVQKIPTVNIATAVGWPKGAKPVPAPGLSVQAFATELSHPRWLYVLANGDVLVAETNAPERKGGGIRGWIMHLMMKEAGAGVKSPDRITLLRDRDGDGVAEFRSTFLAGLKSPFGMTVIGDWFYTAGTDRIERYRYKDGMTSVTGGSKVADLPAGPINHHWTKNIISSRDGKRLYATVGSNSNHAEHGMEHEIQRAGILEIDPESGETAVYASGLRNPNGMAWNPETGELWTVVNERDELGNDLVPDYLTSVRRHGFYGWPYSYFGSNPDPRLAGRGSDLISRAIVPDYALGAHVGALGLAFNEGSGLGEQYAGGAFVGLHGSWNRRTLNGYKVAYVPFNGGMPSGEMKDVLTGFVNDAGEARGRPVGVAIDGAGSLLVADDAGNVIWRVSKPPATAATSGN